MSDVLLREDEQGLITVTLNRPDKLNAITPDMLDGIGQAVADLRDDSEQRVLLIRSRGSYFSSGMDISDGMNASADSGLAFRHWYRRSLHTLFDEIEAVEKPVVMAIHGPCLGGALEMACSCDFRLAAKEARFRLPEIKLGILPGSGGTSRLTRLLGPANAKWLVMAGKDIDATRALQMGLIHTLWEESEFADSVEKFCLELAALPKEALAMAKITIDTVADLDRTGARQVERIANTTLLGSEEHRAIMDEFLQRKQGNKASTSET